MQHRELVAKEIRSSLQVEIQQAVALERSAAIATRPWPRDPACRPEDRTLTADRARVLGRGRSRGRAGETRHQLAESCAPRSRAQLERNQHGGESQEGTQKEADPNGAAHVSRMLLPIENSGRTKLGEPCGSLRGDSRAIRDLADVSRTTRSRRRRRCPKGRDRGLDRRRLWRC
jgi:hypothetical protein